MDNPSKASASVIAAVVVAVLCALFFLLSCSVALIGLFLVKLPSSVPELPPFAKAVELAIIGLVICLSIFGIITGVALIYLRNWARISILIWGGVFAFFGAVGIPFAFLLPKISPPDAPQLPESSQQLLQWILVFVYGLPLVIGVWWLILFNRKSIKAQFAGTSASVETALPQKPRCPLFVVVLSWFYIASILNLGFLPIIPVRVPVFLFGVELSGRTGISLLLLTCVGFFIGGVALLKLKPWGYYLTIALQALWLASGAVSLMNRNYETAMASYMRDSRNWMHAPEMQFPPEPTAQSIVAIMAFGLVVAAVILGLFLYYRQRFLEAASAATKPSGQHVTL